MTRNIQILLATYNAGPYLAGQFESLRAQTAGDFEVLVADGGSTDGTVEAIRAEAARDPRIRLVATGRAGTVANFARLFRQATADYVFFCDQDDVWLPEKVAKSLAAIRRAEAESPGRPIALFHDARVVDADLREIAASSFARQTLNPHRTALRQLLLQNVAAGNTICVNRALRERIGAIPDAAVMHDHWVLLAAAAFGRIVLLDESLLLYRQHAQNVLGAADGSLVGLLAKARGGLDRVRARLKREIDQAILFRDRYRAALSPADAALLDAVAALPTAGWWARRRILLRQRIFKNGFARNLGTLLAI